MNNQAHLRPQDYDSNGDIIPMSMKEEKGDLISRKWLTDAIRNRKTYLSYEDAKDIIDLIDSAPSVYDNPYSDGREDGYIEGYEEAKREHKRQDECVDISKLRLMTVEECAGHTIDYAMGWKACIEWIKGGAE